MYTVDNTTATSAILPNLWCNTEYTISIYARGDQAGKTSGFQMASLPARGIHLYCNLCTAVIFTICIPAPPTPTEVTAWFVNASSAGVTWQWTSSGPAPNCFNTTSVTYHPEEGDETSLQLSDPVATGTTLTDLQCNTNYTITVVATAGEHRRESEAMTVFVPLQGIPQHACTLCSLENTYLSILDIPTPFGVKAEVTPDNTSVGVSWEWSHDGVPMCVDNVRVDY